jgi:hypothetical protein
VLRAATRREARVAEEAEFTSDEDFRPWGTVAIVALFTVTLILLWLSIYLILLARGVTT